MRAYDYEREVVHVFRFETLGLVTPLATALKNSFVALFGHTSAESQRKYWQKIAKFSRFLRASGLAELTPLPPTVVCDLRAWLDGSGISQTTARGTLNVCLSVLAYCERNAPHILSRGTRLVIERYPVAPPKHRNVLQEDDVKKILLICQKEIEAIEERLALGWRLRRGVPRTAEEALQVPLIKKLLVMGNGSLPSKDVVAKSGRSLIVPVASLGGLRKISRTLWLCPEALLPFYLAILIQTSGNPSSIQKMKRDCLVAHPLRSDLERVVWAKLRSHAEQHAEAPTGRPWSAPNLVRRLRILNDNLVEKCTNADRDKLFIAYRISERNPGLPCAALLHHLLSEFIKQHDIPSFSFSGLRRAGAVAHHRASGTIRTVQLRLNHTSIEASSRYTDAEGSVRDFHDLTVRRFQGLMVQASLESGSVSEPFSVARVPVPENSAETVFGFRCRNPFAGIARGSTQGSLCLQFQKCATCPGALIPLDDIAVVAQLLSAHSALNKARERAIQEGWMARFELLYEPTWRVLVNEILPAVSNDVKACAMERMDERLIPRLE